MVPRKILPSRRRLKQLFDYNQDTGVLTRKALPRSAFATDGAWKKHQLRAGYEIAAPPSQKYIQVWIGNSTRFQAHRIIWKWMTGREPPPHLDHINWDGTDNRWSN